MAKCEVIRKEKVVVESEEYVLHLSLEEAHYLRALLGTIGGHPSDYPSRAISSNIWDVLTIGLKGKFLLSGDFENWFAGGSRYAHVAFNFNKERK